jgi:hypothetical protein
MSQGKLKKVIGITVAAIVLLAIVSPKSSTPAVSQAAPTVVQPFSRAAYGDSMTEVERLRTVIAILGVYHTKCEELPSRVADQLVDLLKEHRDWMRPYIREIEDTLKKVGTSQFCASFRKTVRSIEL